MHPKWVSYILLIYLCRLNFNRSNFMTYVLYGPWINILIWASTQGKWCHVTPLPHEWIRPWLCYQYFSMLERIHIRGNFLSKKLYEKLTFWPTDLHNLTVCWMNYKGPKEFWNLAQVMAWLDWQLQEALMLMKLWFLMEIHKSSIVSFHLGFCMFLS